MEVKAPRRKKKWKATLLCTNFVLGTTQSTLNVLYNVFLLSLFHSVLFFQGYHIIYIHYIISTKDKFGDDYNKRTASARVRKLYFFKLSGTYSL